jgi:hypothetical protein
MEVNSVTRYGSWKKQRNLAFFDAFLAGKLYCFLVEVKVS